MNLALGMWAALAATGPFSELSPKLALEDSSASGGIVVVEVSSSLDKCGQNPWTDTRIQRWVEKNATAVYVDMVRRGKWRAEVVGEDAWETDPMRVAYVDGVEVDRVCGCRDVNKLGAWLTGIPKGQTERALWAERYETTELKLKTGLSLANAYRCAKQPDKAAEVLVDMFERIPLEAPEYNDQRGPRVGYEIGTLVVRHTEAREVVTARRDAMESEVSKDVHALDNWFAYNRILHDDAKTLEWFDAHRDDPAAAETVERAAYPLYDVLVANRRLSDAGEMVQGVQWTDRAMAAGADHLNTLYQSLLHAERADLATEVLVRTDAMGGSVCEVIGSAVDQGMARKDQKKWLKGCSDPELSERWKAGLGNNN